MATYAVARGIMLPQRALYLGSIHDAGTIAGSTLLGIIHYWWDSSDLLTLYACPCLAMAGLSFAWIGIYDVAGLIVFAVAHGITWGAYIPLLLQSIQLLAIDHRSVNVT